MVEYSRVKLSLVELWYSVIDRVKYSYIVLYRYSIESGRAIVECNRFKQSQVEQCGAMIECRELK